MPAKDLHASEMMSHLLDSLNAGQDIGHYGRLVFAMIARHFLSEEELSEYLQKNPGFSDEEAKALIRQVQGRDYNPPRRERILDWQKQQEFPICPNAEDPDACNVYKDLKFPDEIYENIQSYQEKKAEAQQKDAA
jgi:DNA primase large subunit